MHALQQLGDLKDAQLEMTKTLRGHAGTIMSAATSTSCPGSHTLLAPFLLLCRCTPGAMLFESAPDAKPASTTATGIQLLMGAFVKDAMPSLQDLKERQEQADRVQQTRIDYFVEMAMALQKASAQVVQERESKRQRLSQDSALAIAKGG